MGNEEAAIMNQAIWDIGDVADYSSKVQSGIDNLIDITDADLSLIHI